MGFVKVLNMEDILETIYPKSPSFYQLENRDQGRLGDFQVSPHKYEIEEELEPQFNDYQRTSPTIFGNRR